MVTDEAAPGREDATAFEGLTAEQVARAYELAPLPVEGGWYRRTWAGDQDGTGRPAGSSILLLLTDGDGFSALHRLPIDEVWHFYRGDPVELLLLHPDRGHRLVVLGGRGTSPRVQFTVPAGTWMGARVRAGGAWSLLGTTMAPGFRPTDYEGGDMGTLLARYPERAELIRSLCRPGAATSMEQEVE
ncbi:cupin domain-containing protein [Streptomyces sp. NPDC048297]|uniref:cupin domain-containing protein n=1 Tax=Streptomyces sp. NPDC048297 TaxID=3365531 RepID=UPI00371BF011